MIEVLNQLFEDFIYNYSEINLLENENINEYGFVLDNNNFLDDNIKLSLIFYNEELDNNQKIDNNLLIDNIKFIVIEKCKDNYNPQINLPIIINSNLSQTLAKSFRSTAVDCKRSGDLVTDNIVNIIDKLRKN